MKDFLDLTKLKNLIKKYSEFINYPIYLYVSKEVTKEVEQEDEDKKKDDIPEELDQIKEDEGKEEEEKDKKKTTTKTETIWEWEVINNTKAIWLRPIDEIDDDDYKKFYKAMSKDYQNPMTWIHFKAEGEIEFTALLFISKAAPVDFQKPESEEKKSSLKLYVRRVLISDKFEELLPGYLSFVKGVVDSDDLPLNVSRETLQQLRVLKTIKKKLTRKILERLIKYAKQKIDEEKELDSDDLAEEEKKEKQERVQKKKSDMKKKFE